MSSLRGSYGAALRVTMRNTAAAYGYTLSTAATIAVLGETAGKPDTGRLFLFAFGGVTAFAASVCAALGMATLIAHLVRSPLAWFLAQLGTTAIYMLVVAVEVTVAAALQRRV